MPFPDLTAMGFSNKEDSSKFGFDPVDPSMTYQTEGGVFISRRRFTRDPGYTITTGFTNISQTDMNHLNDFYKSVFGGSVAFNYVHPTTAVTYSVRFVKTWKSSYVGIGSGFRWNVDNINLQTV
jgi:hypothetical protein